ncbi:MAG: UDP-N-acetylmuramate dehydrogenase [Clostridia bacterium]
MVSKLEDVISKEKIKYNEPMNKHTTMKVGGNADILILPTNIDEVISVIKYVKENNIPFKVLGNGSNTVVSDKGIEGVVMKLTSNLSDVIIEDKYITAVCGTMMPYLSVIAKQNLLSGFEFACGIPGTIGGGIKMNAGAYDSQISDVIVSCKYLDENLDIIEIENKDMNFGYRHSIFIENPNFVILEAKFKLNKDSLENIESKMSENKLSRIAKQPLEYPSVGSIFRRPVGYFAGKLISDCNLKGVTIGGMQVSEKHAGFIVNKGNGTCQDLLDLIKLIQKTVYENFKVEMKTEVEFIGRDIL